MPPLPRTQRHTERFRGGLDTDTAWPVPAGRIEAGANFEVDVSGAYRDVEGYQRTDGRPAPDKATYFIVNHTEEVASGGTYARRDGDRRLRFNGTKYARWIGDWGDAVLASELTDMAGEIDDSLELEVGDSIEYSDDEGSSWTSLDNSVMGFEGAALPGPADHLQTLAASAQIRREQIEPLPGSGPVRGVWMFDDTLYGARDNAGATALDIHKATADGWEKIAVGAAPVKTVRFSSGSHTGGTAESPGRTLTNLEQGGSTYTGKSANTDPDPIVVLLSGAWADDDAAGLIVFHEAVDVDDGNATVTATDFEGSLTLEGVVFTLNPGGRVETVRANPGYGLRLYGVDGKNKAWEFDGDTLLQIDTENDDDTPDHAAWHQDRLFLSFGRSLQASAPGNPFGQTAALGAAEFALAATINALHNEPGQHEEGALLICSRNQIDVLYGTGPSDWKPQTYRHEIGAHAGTVQEIAQTIFLDDRGVRYLRTGQEFGNFTHSTLTEHIQTRINETLRATEAVGSCIVRRKNQYRLFFADGDALYFTFHGDRLLGIMPVHLEVTVSCITSVEDSTGQDRIFFGATSGGHVYELDRGTSFDGEEIQAWFCLHPNYIRGQQGVGILKTWEYARLIAKGAGYAEYDIGFLTLDDTDSDRTAVTYRTVGRQQPAVWDVGVWDVGVWDGAAVGPTRIKLYGEGESMVVTIVKNSDWMPSILLSGMFIEYKRRRLLR